MAKYYVGTSGWHYDHWRGAFYPEKLPKAAWLDFYTKEFDTVELNNTFYRLPSEKAVATWHDSTPPGFAFAVKASRYITHIKRLKAAGESVAEFFTRIGVLADKLGPILYQTPPGMHRDEALLEAFLASLPPGNRHVFEFRHESWMRDSVFEILHNHKAGFCIFDMPDLTTPVLATSDFAYLRFHGSAGLYSSQYTDHELSNWADKITNLATGLNSVYIYFNNDIGGYAVENAITLRARLGA